MPLIPAVVGALVALSIALGWGCWHLLESRGAVRAELRQAEAANQGLVKQIEDANAERARVDALLADRTKLSRALASASAADRKTLEDARHADVAVNAWADGMVPVAVARRLQWADGGAAAGATAPATAPGAAATDP